MRGFKSELQKFEQLVKRLKSKTKSKIYTIVSKEDFHRVRFSTLGVYPIVGNVTHPRWAQTWHKQSFVKTLVPHMALKVACDRVLWLDNDVRPQKDIEHIFNAQAPAMVQDNKGIMLNSGVMLLNITSQFVNEWDKFVQKRYKKRQSGGFEGGDQELWNEFFNKKTVYQLPREYNANRRTPVNRSEVVLAHFIIGEGGSF